jgi:hypothetical protein
VLFSLFVAYALSGYVIYAWRKAKGLQVSVISTSTNEPDEQGLHEQDVVQPPPISTPSATPSATPGSSPKA